MESDSDVSFEQLSDDEKGPQTSRRGKDSWEKGSKATKDTEDIESRQGPTTITSWKEVDTTVLSENVAVLVSSIVSTVPRDDTTRDLPWQPVLAVSEGAEIMDPLGMGRIDYDSARLVKPSVAADPTAMQRGIARTSVSLHSHPSHKSVVGKLISDLAHPAVGGPSNTAEQTAGALIPGTHLPMNKVVLHEEQFDPQCYLGLFHQSSSLEELQRGVKVLDKELSQRNTQLKQLVKQNFHRFSSCKNTIDDIYSKLQRIETESAGISTEVLYKAIQEVQMQAKRSFGPVLERHVKAERIKNVMNLLKRFNNLFNMPARVRQLFAEGDYDAVISDYRRANALIQPSPSTPRVWTSLHQEIEKRVSEVYSHLRSLLEDPFLPASTAPSTILYMVQLKSEGLPAAREEDAVLVYLDNLRRHFDHQMNGAVQEYQAAWEDLEGRYRMIMKLKDEEALEVERLVRWQGDPEGDAISLPAKFLESDPQSSRPAGAGFISEGCGGTLARPRSVLIPEVPMTSAEKLLLNHVCRLCRILVEGLPNFWAVCTSSRFSNPLDITTSDREAVQLSLKQSTGVVQALMTAFADNMRATIDRLATVGPLATSLLMLVQELSSTFVTLQDAQCPVSAIEGVMSQSSYGIGVTVRALSNHLMDMPARLLSLETWTLHHVVGHRLMVTFLPETVQAEVECVMSYYQQLVRKWKAADKIPAQYSWQPLQSAYLETFEVLVLCLKVMGDKLKPDSAALAEVDGQPTRSTKATGGTTSSRTGAGGSKGTPAGASAELPGLTDVSPKLLRIVISVLSRRSTDNEGDLRSTLPEDLKLLALVSNGSFLASIILPNLTDRHTGLLAGSSMDNHRVLFQSVHVCQERLRACCDSLLKTYLLRKQIKLGRILSNYIRPDGSPVGAPPELRDITEGAYSLVQQLSMIQAEVSTHAPDYQAECQKHVSEYLLEEISRRLTSLGPQLPLETLLQYYLDLCYVDPALSGTDHAVKLKMDGCYLQLINRAVRLPAPSPSASVSPVMKTLQGIKDPAELNRRVMGMCQRIILDVTNRGYFNTRCFVA